MNTTPKIVLLYHTLRHLDLPQFWWRGRRVLKRRMVGMSGRRAPRVFLPYRADRQPLWVGLKDIHRLDRRQPDVADLLQDAEAIRNHRFSFQGRDVDFGATPDWHSDRVSQLWNYNLHYFEYLKSLAVEYALRGNPEAIRAFMGLATSWIEGNSTPQGDGWHPYTLSLRLVSWLEAWAVFGSTPECSDEFTEEFLTSLGGQAAFLSADLEFDVRGNHLLKNLKALIWAGLCLEGRTPALWLQRGLRVLEREVAEQVLPDGGHFERAPGYHAAVLQDLLEIGVLLDRNTGERLKWLDDAVRRMAGYMDGLVFRDLSLPLFKDTARDACLSPADLLAAASVFLNAPDWKRTDQFGLYPFLLFGETGRERYESWPVNTAERPSVGMADSGFFVMRDDRAGDELVVDGGRPCPDYLPAHAHADMFSFELRADGRTVAVDSGVYEYQSGPWRDFFRSTPAHNTVAVQGLNQSEVWSSFRVGRRARPGPVFWQNDGEQAVFQAEHDGYRRLPQRVRHQRTIIWRKGLFWLIVDRLTGNDDVRAESYLHFHPDVHPVRHEGGWRMDGVNRPLWIKAFGMDEERECRGAKHPPQGWYSETFGRMADNSVLQWTRQAELPFVAGYVIARTLPDSMTTRTSSGGVTLSLRFGRDEYQYEITGRNAQGGPCV